jgi:hypothetical protein
LSLYSVNTLPGTFAAAIILIVIYNDYSSMKCIVVSQ